MIEVKDGKRPPSARKLTEAQEDFVAGWRGHWCLVTSADDAVGLLTRGSES